MTQSVLFAVLRGTARDLALGVVAGGSVYLQGQPLRIALTTGAVATAYAVLSQLVPAGAAAKLGQAAAPMSAGLPRP